MLIDIKQIISTSNTLGKNERLKSRKLIGQLFKEGSAFSTFPFRVLYLISSGGPNLLQAGFSVSIRNFKKATERNRIRRLMRECYRTQKHPLLTLTENKNFRLSVFFIYTGKDIPGHDLIKDKTAVAIASLINKLVPADI